MKSISIFILSAVFCVSICDARIINVPQNQRTIQRGINAAQAGDTVLVQPGMYHENLRITEPITLAGLTLLDSSPAWIDSTIVEAADSACVLTISGDEGVVHLRGFTIQGGYCEDWGGGIIGGGRSAILEDLVIRENFTGRSGGGLYWGGACDSFICRRVRIYGNRAALGGGVCLWSATNTSLYDCSITDNYGGQYGALFSHASDVIMKDVLIANNRTSSDIWSVILTSCEEREATISLDRVTVVNNVSSQGGWPDNDVLIRSEGGNRMDATLRNCIFDGDDDNRPIRVFAQGAIRFDAAYCDLEGGRDGFQIGDGVESIIGDGIIDSDPLFVDPDNGDYHLSENSPCIDAGDPDSPRDPDGTRADMGSYFFNQNDPPEVIHQIDVVTVDEDCGLDAIADLDTIFADPNGDTLTYSVFGQEQLGLSVNEEGVLSIEPALNFNGDSLMVVVSAHDASNSAAVRFLVTVSTVNDPPTRFELIAPADSFHIRTADFPIPIPFYWTRSSDPDGNQDVRYLFRIECQLEEYNQIVEVPAEADSFYYQLGPMPSTVEFAWRVQAISGDDTTDCVQSFHFWIEGFNDVAPIGEHPSQFAINTLSPNPFNSSTTIRFSVGQVSKPVSLAVYGLDGRLVQVLWTGRDSHSSTEHSVVWNADGLPGGVYLVRLESGNKTQTIKAVLMK